MYGRHAPRRGTTSECFSCGTSSDGPTAITARSVAARRADVAAGRTRGVHAANHVRRRSARGACTTCSCCLACRGAQCRSRPRLSGPSASTRGTDPVATGPATDGTGCRPSSVQRAVRAASCGPDRTGEAPPRIRESVCQQCRAEQTTGVATTGCWPVRDVGAGWNAHRRRDTHR